MTINKLLLTAALATPAALAFATPAQAQVAGIAQANPIIAMGKSQIFRAIDDQVRTMFKANLDQAASKERARQQLLSQLDKNNDHNVDQEELDAATAAKNPAIPQIAQLENEMNTLNEPASRAEAYAVEQSLVKAYNTAVQKVVADRKISVVLNPSSLVYAPESSDVTDEIIAEMDKSARPAVTAPPSTWSTPRDLPGLLQQLQQVLQIVKAMEAQKAGTPAPGAAPARPAPAKPATQPQSR